jgi:hypothetical protein
LGGRWARGWNGCGKRLEHAELRDLDTGLPITREANIGGVKRAVRVVDGGGFAVPVRRQPPLVVVRIYRAFLATKLGKWGRPLAPKTILESHRAVLCFLRWARREGYAVDPRILELTAPRVPDKEPTVYHIA